MATRSPGALRPLPPTAATPDPLEVAAHRAIDSMLDALRTVEGLDYMLDASRPDLMIPEESTGDDAIVDRYLAAQKEVLNEWVRIMGPVVRVVLLPILLDTARTAALCVKVEP
jgi:hypothetical protein